MKPRIIIADTDENYIAPLQLKFAKELHDQVDLEIITQRAYFEELFSKPQKAEILVVSDDLYNPNLLRHNLDHIFLMQEQPNESQEADMRVTRLFKYSSIVAIFNDILGKSLESLNNSISKKKKTQIILVTSAAGGVGKTTIAMGIAANLTQNYKKVLYINAARLQTFQYLLENKAPISSTDIYEKILNVKKITYEDIRHIIRKERFYYLPPFKAALISLGLKYVVFYDIILSAKKNGEYDFVIVDTDAIFDEESAKMMDCADKVIVVTKQEMSSVFATTSLVSNINNIDTEKYMFVCNDFNKEKINAFTSQETLAAFTVDEYVEHFDYCKKVNLSMFAEINGIRRIAFRIM